MQFTEKSKEHIDSCRFCWMCHHVCPIGNATGLERNTARARALGLSLVARDAVEYSDDIINNVYECSLCGGCMTDCVTGWDPIMFTKEARLGAALDGKLPQYVMDMITNLTEKGNIYGADKNPNIPVCAARVPSYLWNIFRIPHTIKYPILQPLSTHAVIFLNSGPGFRKLSQNGQDISEQFDSFWNILLNYGILCDIMRLG